jgi:DNA-binding PadR family transcriptional regulator
MRLRNIVLGLVLALFLVLVGVLVYVLASTEILPEADHSPTTFSVIEAGTAGDFAYGVYNYRGAGNITALTLTGPPRRNVVIINDSQAIEADRLPELIDQMRQLEAYGYNVTVTSEPRIGDYVYILPTGAIPSYALFNLQGNSSNGTILYIGGKDLLLSSGIKKLQWYDALSPEQKSRVVVYNGTLNDFLDQGNVSLAHEVLYSTWMLTNSTSYQVADNGLRTAVARLNGSGYMRVIYDFTDVHGIYDSPRLQSAGQVLTPAPPVIFPWEKSSLEFSLNKTNGTAFFSVRKDGKVIEHDQLRRVTDENVFIKRLEYQDPGEYVMVVDDNSGTIATGLLHVKDIQIHLADHRGYTYVFSVMVDGQPLKDAEAMVSLGNSSKRKYFVSDGQLVLNAKLDKGVNVFNMDIGDASIPVTIDNTEEPLLEFYLTYGLPALLVVFGVYFGARITRRPTYSLRFGDSPNAIRQEMTLPVERAIESFRMIRNDMKLGDSPITPQEFTVSLKRYLTNGADVTEGNVEEILKKLVKSGRLETHRDYYQLKGEGDVVRNALRRMMREKLIESGTMFREVEGRFVTKDFELGFFGEKFTKKAVIIVDDKSEEKRILGSMDEAERARLRIMESNDMISFVPIDRLSDVL